MVVLIFYNYMKDKSIRRVICLKKYKAKLRSADFVSILTYFTGHGAENPFEIRPFSVIYGKLESYPERPHFGRQTRLPESMYPFDNQYLSVSDYRFEGE